VLGLAIALSLFLQYPFLTQTAHDFDAIHLYQPLAKGFLSDGFRFFANEASLQAPPFSYVYQAMFGASLTAIRWANLVLSAATLCLVFRSGWLLHSRLAGLISAIVFATCPLLKEFMVAPLTEGPFIFLSACWFWALCEWFTGRGAAFLAIASVALALAVLTRATLLYWIVIVIAAFAWLTLRTTIERRERARGALLAHVIAIIPPAAFTAKNLAVFGFGFLATGAGNALYEGNHPVTGGYDAPYVGLIADVGQITREPSHLTLPSEKRLMQVARGLVHDADPMSLVELHSKKAAAFLFVTKAVPGASDLRSWRIALMILAAIGFAAIRDRWLRWLLAGAVAYQIASYIPVLYTHRYSVAIDPWLMLAAGVGVASLWSRRRIWEVATVVGAIIVSVGLGRYLVVYMDDPEPNVLGAARMLVWEGAPQRFKFASDNPGIEIPIRNAPLFHPWNANVLLMDVALTPNLGDSGCGQVRFTYRRDNEAPDDQFLVHRLTADGEIHRHQFGMNPIHLNAEGTLHIDINCAKGGNLAIEQIRLYTPLAGIVYAQRYLGLPPPRVLPIEQ
jgi:4-amino-4-deoxy-L-arabinose transferase-like glycosyltransferase